VSRLWFCKYRPNVAVHVCIEVIMLLAYFELFSGLKIAALLTEVDCGLGLTLALGNMVLNLDNISGKQHFKNITPTLTV